MSSVASIQNRNVLWCEGGYHCTLWLKLQLQCCLGHKVPVATKAVLTFFHHHISIVCLHYKEVMEFEHTRNIRILVSKTITPGGNLLSVFNECCSTLVTDSFQLTHFSCRHYQSLKRDGLVCPVTMKLMWTWSTSPELTISMAQENKYLVLLVLVALSRKMANHGWQ